jgi:Tol biopolymer transport system component
LSRLTSDSLPEHRPRWSSSGKSIFFIRSSGGRGILYRQAASQTSAPEPVLRNFGLSVYEAAWSRDTTWLLVRLGGTLNVVGGRDISAMRIGKDTVPRPLVASTQFDESSIALSPDSRWLAYEANETTRSELYIRPFPNADSTKRPVSTDGGRAPLWSRNGRELFYVNAAREMMVVTVGAGPRLELGVPRRLFKLRSELYLTDLERYTPFDISPDGQRFLMARRVSRNEAQVAPLILTQNWFAELRAITQGK